ncbi:MAG: Isovaleryl-CoA dehydrogenase, partial [uncultured Solirubrobacteraceae bacterium]
HHGGGGVGRPGPRLPRALRGDGGGLPRQRLHRPQLRRPLQSLRQPDPPLGQRRAEAPLPAQADLRRARRRAGHVRGRGRLRRHRHEAPRRAPRRPLRPQRHQVLDHQRARGEHPRRLRQDRAVRGLPRRHRLPDREGFQGLPRLPQARQDGHARLRHRRAGVRGLRGPRRERDGPAQRRRRRADERPRLRARRALRRAARHHAGLPRRGPALRARAQAVRPPHRLLPADAGQGRRHVRRPEQRPRLRLRGGQGLRRRQDHPLRRRRRHPVRQRERGEDLPRGHPGPRRRRLHQGVARRALPARRQALRHRRRHQRDPPLPHRPRAGRGV